MSTSARRFYEFDAYRIDDTEQVLLRNGVPVPLPPKLFDTLLVLVRNSGHIVEKEVLIKEVWPDTFVEENNLSQHISTLRRTLGDGRHEQRYIETVPRRGYRFAVNVREEWGDDREQTIREVHTKVNLSVKEETEEIVDAPQARRQSEMRPQVTVRSNRFVVLTVAAVVVVAAGTAFGIYQFNGQRGIANESPVAQRSAYTPNVDGPPLAQTVTIKTFDPSVWPRTDEEIGVLGFVIEDFEDAKLVNGLQIELSDSSTDNFGPTDHLPLVFHPDINDLGGARVFVPGIWDGNRVLINRVSPSPPGYSDFAWGDITFHIAGGASSFGFSLHEMDLNTELSVNGISQFNLRRLLPSGSTRGGYVRIDAKPGSAIYSVKVANGANRETGDGLAFDHVAFTLVQSKR